MAKLKFYGGSGFAKCREFGKLEVRATETKEFDNLSEAKKYYNSLNEEKSIWDISKIPEMLECHFFSYT